MGTPLRLYIAGLVGAAALGLLATSLVIPLDPHIALEIDGDPSRAGALDILAGVGFWIVITLLASALPVRLTDGVQVAVSTAPLMAATLLGGPTAGAWVALIGTTDMRELRGRVPWYGTLANHAGIVLPVIVGGLAIQLLRGRDNLLQELSATLLGTLIYFLLNLTFVSLTVVFRTGKPLAEESGRRPHSSRPGLAAVMLPSTA